MIPALSALGMSAVESNAERTFYGWCRDFLPSSMTVLYSVRWTYRESGKFRDGEADFVICDENCGVVIVEVKGGGVRRGPMTGEWETVDRNGRVSKLKRSPIAQARDSKYALLKFLEETPGWRRLFPQAKPWFAHAAFFPDLDRIDPLVGVDSPMELIGGRIQGGPKLRQWLNGVNGPSGQEIVKVGPGGVAALVAALVPAIDVRPLIKSALDEAEAQRMVLSVNQSSTLSNLSRYNRASITGGAGTGKTVLAVEKTRRLAGEGKKTLLLCYNRPLARVLAKSLEAFPNAGAMTFHELCGRMLQKVKFDTRRDLKLEVQQEHPDWDLYDRVLPEALARAAEFVEDRFDAVIVDEGQDFRSSYWFPIELFTKDGESGTLYVFFDENQRLYGGTDTNPIATQPFLLNRNCRNAVPIHRLAYTFYEGDPIESSEIVGKVSRIDAPSLIVGARAIANTINDLVGSERVDTNQICVLIAGTPKVDFIEALESLVLAKNVRWRGIDDQPTERSILVTTVQQFKGLESDVVFLWGIDLALESDREELVYVGASRAKSHLYLVDDSSSLNADA